MIEPLVALIKTGDHNAFLTFVSKYKAALYEAALTLTGSGELASRCCMDVFAMVWRNRGSLDPLATLDTRLIDYLHLSYTKIFEPHLN